MTEIQEPEIHFRPCEYKGCGGVIGRGTSPSRGFICFRCGPPELIPAERPEAKERANEPRWGGEFI